MKKTLLMLVILATGIANAQTQQETQTWLSEKLSEYLKPHKGVYGGVGFTNLKVTNVEPCSITITFDQKHLIKNKHYNTTTIVLPTQGVTILEHGGIQYKEPVISSTMTTASKSQTKQLDHTPDIFIENGEENLYAKIIVKLQHLATFCIDQSQTLHTGTN